MTTRLPPQFRIGFEEIDLQHRALFEKLQLAMDAASSDDLAGSKSALLALRDYLVAHFAAEESFMAESQYPDRAAHKTAHDLFMQDFAQLAREIETMGLSVPNVAWIVTRVPEWIKFHIRVNDAPLGQYLASKRFQPSNRTRTGDKPRVA